MVEAAARPRVALFSRQFLPYSQTFVYDEVRHHTRYDVDVFCHTRVNQERFPYEHVHALAPAHGALGALEAWTYRNLLYSPRFHRTIAAGGHCLLHAHFGMGGQWALPIAARLDLPLVVTLHGFDVTALATPRRYAPKHWRYALLSPWLLRRTTRFLAASEELKALIEKVGAPPERVHVWRLGVELPTVPRLTEDPRDVLMVGRFVEKKGFEFGIRAFASVAERFPESRLVIVGDGDLGPSLRALVARLELKERVEFAGVLAHQEVLARMARAAVLLAPSVVAATGDRESGLIVVKEAAARAVPSVASRHGGIPEIIEDGVSGYLVEERDVPTLAERLAGLLGDEALRRQIGAAARERMEREYDIRVRVRELERHYDETVQVHRRA